MKKLILLFLVSAAFAQEPIKFRGAYIGQPLSDYVDCSSGKAKSVHRTHGKLCQGNRGVVFNMKTKGWLDPKDSGEAFYFEGQKLTMIKIIVPNEDWQKVRYDLTQKLGPPSSEVPDVYQNGFSARWEFDQGFWVKGDVVVYAGIKALTMFGTAVPRAVGNGPATAGIWVTITDAVHAKLPSTTPNSMD